MKEYQKTLLKAASQFEKLTGKSRATAASVAANDGKFFDRIEKGGGCTVDTFNAVMGWLSEHTPVSKNSKRFAALDKQIGNVNN